MAILNYRTEVPPERTIAEITALLVRKGANKITTEYTTAGTVKAVTFVMDVGGFPVRFELPANAAGVAAVLLRDEPWNSRRSGTNEAYELKLRQRAEWISWRILKDWVAAQMALIESGQAEPAQVFLPYVVNEQGMTMFQSFVESNRKKLGTGAE